MPSKVSVKSITSNVGWSILSKTSTFGLKFVTVPILARIFFPKPRFRAPFGRYRSAALPERIICAVLILLMERKLVRKLLELVRPRGLRSVRIRCRGLKPRCEIAANGTVSAPFCPFLHFLTTQAAKKSSPTQKNLAGH